MTKQERKLFMDKVLTSIQEDQVTYLAAQTGYHFIVALVPFLIVFLNIVMMIVHSKIHMITQTIETVQFLPDETKPVILTLMQGVINNRSASILSFSLLVALWSSSNAVDSLRRALNLAFNVDTDKHFMVAKGKSILFTLLIVAMTLTVMIFLAFGNLILETLENYFKIEIPFVVSFLQYFIPIAGLIFSFSLFFKYAPDYRKSRTITWKSALLGGLLTTIGWLIITFAYSFYVSNFSNMNLMYGPLVGIFALFVWFYLSGLMIIVAAEITSAYDQIRQGVFYSK